MILLGKFHSHITVPAEHKELAISVLKMAGIRFKATTIELSGVQVDTMITQHFHTRKFLSYENIETYVKDTARLLETFGAKVLRIKIEHEDLPTLNPRAERYRECHIKLRIYPNTKLPQDLQGFVLSRNPNEVTKEYEHRFLNCRTYSGTVEDFDEKVDKFIETIKEHVIEVKKESTILDTNLALDKWWA